jgi:DNA-binding MurR/RpiR family transcriptional regulator
VSDAKLESFKASLNASIHELVFACQHLDQDDLEDAANCLMTAQATIESVAGEIVTLEGGAR